MTCKENLLYTLPGRGSSTQSDTRPGYGYGYSTRTGFIGDVSYLYKVKKWWMGILKPVHVKSKRSSTRVKAIWPRVIDYVFSFQAMNSLTKFVSKYNMHCVSTSPSVQFHCPQHGMDTITHSSYAGIKNVEVYII